MEECSFVEEIETGTSPIIDGENTKFTTEDEDCLKNELSQEQPWRKGPNLVELESVNDRCYIKAEIEAYEEKPLYNQVKIENAEDSSILEHYGCDENDTSANCSIKQECDYNINEEIEIKNDLDSESRITSENSSLSCSYDTEYSFQSKKGMENRTRKPENEEINEENLDELNKLKREKLIERNFEEQRKMFQCNICDFTTKYKNYMRTHIDHVHLKLKKYHCRFCDFKTNTESSVKIHIDSVHLGKRQHKCSECDYSTAWRSNLQTHMNSKHPKVTVGKPEKELKCDLCDYMTKSKSYLNDHMNFVHLRKQYKCEECDYSTAWISSLGKHRKIKHSGSVAQFKCDLCEFTTRHEKFLKSHMDGVHLKVKRYKCRFCGYRAIKMQLLEAHINSIHLSEKHYKCDECNFSSTWKASLHKHKKKHDKSTTK